MIKYEPYYYVGKLTPLCQICGEVMINVYDNKEKKINMYLWKTTCKHNKDFILSMG